jgi:predicted ATPase
VIETFEHVSSAAAFVAELAIACPRLVFLVTSRTALGVRGEHEISLAPLAVPAIAAGIADLDRYPATALFLERARAVRPDLALDPASAATIGQICRRLEGLPLALELAAVRVRHMPLATLKSALDHRLDVLVGGPRDLPPRLRTMRDAIAWSEELLPPRAQSLFRTVSVFAGGWTLAAAESISVDGGARLLDDITALVDNHLVTIDEGGGDEPRFRMLDVVREFAAEQAAERREANDLARRHATFFANLAETAELERAGPAQESWYRRLQAEQDNMRAALQYAVAHDEGPLAQRLAGALWLYWRRHGDYAEARSWLDRALQASGPGSPTYDRTSADSVDAADGPSRRKVLWGDAWISYYQGDYPHLRRLGEELLQLAEQGGDRVGIRNGLTIRALVAMADERFDDALGPLEECVRICRASCPPWLLATSLLVLGQATMHGADLSRSRRVLEEALAMYERLGDRLFVARTNGYLGYASLLSGDARAARRLFAASLRGFTQLEERFGIAEELQAMAALAASDGQDERAATFAGAAHGVWASMSAQPLASDRPIARRYLDPASRRLGSAAWRSAYRNGQAMDLAVVVRLALGTGERCRQQGVRASMRERPKRQRPIK